MARKTLRSGVAVLMVAQAFAAGRPQLSQKVKLTLSGPTVAVNTIADVDLAADGRILVVDADTRRVAIFSADGRFERFLDAFAGIPPETTDVHRLVALPTGGVILVDDNKGSRFFFYNSELKPERVVRFGIELLNINGFLRHPRSGELWVAAYGVSGPSADKVIHRFDQEGKYLGSTVPAADLPDMQRRGMNTGFLTLDPEDGTVWFSRLVPYEIVHLSQEGEVIGKFAFEPLGGFTPPKPEKIGPKLYRLRGDFTGSCQIALVGGLLVNSYMLENGKVLADIIQRDGTPVETELPLEIPVTLTKRLWNGLLVKFVNQTKTVEVWEERQ